MTTGDCLYGDVSNSATVIENIVGDVGGCEGSSREHKREKSKAVDDGGHCNERGDEKALAGSTERIDGLFYSSQNKEFRQERRAEVGKER